MRRPAIRESKRSRRSASTPTGRDDDEERWEVTATSTRQVSKDGKTMTLTTKGTDEKGVAFDNTLVFKKRAS